MSGDREAVQGGLGEQRTHFAGESSDLQVYNPEVALLEREVIPGRVGYRAGAGRQQ